MQSINSTTHTSIIHCQECHQAIPAKRLLAVPDAQYCVPCQQDHVVKIDLFRGMSKLSGVLAVGAIFHAEDVNEVRSVRTGRY